ncbi:hypothetical protein [Paraliomyxa miuraensis]|uniref:hypothetical protein n=1 Tax=Paraliomyxa miuraensis TaxID=376150 RepID=UPI00224FD812|nr:hypothetical protein [Paraliomyxa miuraensis]MCX4247377.1 hypothetical protein [Paraliomyxa miuraensis]
MVRRLRILLLTASLLIALSCGPLVELPDEDADASGEGTTTATTTTGTTTTPPNTTTSTTTPGTATPPTADDASDDEPPEIPDFVTETCGELGEACVDGVFDCCSGNCYLVGPLGGVCSECDEDADCPQWGCNPASPLEGIPAWCGDGLSGSGCETNAACQPGFVCDTIFEIPGIVETSTCGECSSDTPCPAGNLCAPAYDLSLFAGHWYCVPQGALPPGAGCDEPGTGDLQCASGHCAPASLMGISVIGVCSECESNLDCPGGSCVLPEVVIEGNELVVELGYCG